MHGAVYVGCYEGAKMARNPQFIHTAFHLGKRHLTLLACRTIIIIRQDYS